jgi:diguanylate cyclase (GGDEF)-like protein
LHASRRGLSIFFGITMSLDVNTLFLVTVYVEAILGLLLLFAWVQNPNIRAVAWWGSAHILRAGSIGLFGMYGGIPDAISIDFANAILFTSFAMIWMGARVFDGRPVEPLLLVAGSAIWLIVIRMPGLDTIPEFRFLLGSGIVAAYTWLAAYEFWRGRGEPLVSRLPVIFLMFADGALYLLRTPLAAMLPWNKLSSSNIAGSVWLTTMSFEALLFTISIAFILLAMAKERAELRHKVAAMVDPLTGMANRRAFLLDGELLAKKHLTAPCPVAALVIDLDHFKTINDRFGHAIGDRVLQIFADVANKSLRTTDLVGRVGGEEFAAVLYNVQRDMLVNIAERIRSRFAEATTSVDDCAVGATLSIGVALNLDAPLDVSELLGLADRALYNAKENGRNRIEVLTWDGGRRRWDDARSSDLDAVATKTAA